MMMAAGGLLVMVVMLAGCGAKATATPGIQGFGGEGGGGDGGFQGGTPSPEFVALGRTRQLAVDTLYLQDSDTPLSTDQAAALLPLWQQVKTLEEADTLNPDAVTPVLDQIQGEMTTEQSDLLTNTSQQDLATWAQANGIQAFGPGFGGDRGGGGEGDSGGGRGGDNQPSDQSMATMMSSMAQGTPGPGDNGGQPRFEGTPPAGGDFQEGTPGARRFNNTALIDQVIAALEAM